MADGFGAELHPDDLDALPAGAETDDRRHRQLDRQRELESTMDAEKQAQVLKERYGRNRMAATDTVVVPQRLLLPSVDDPSIWGVRCKAGKEREVVFAIQKRIEERPPGSRKPLKIISAFERGGAMSGYVYVEARRQADVLEALDGMSFVYPRSKMILVPVKEMPDLLRVKKSEELVPGGWVRIKRGKYQGDLAQIEEVETNGLEVTVRLVPRLEYGLNDDSSAPPALDPKRKRPGAANNNTPATRPPQRLFSEAEAKKKHSKYLTPTTALGTKAWSYLGETYVDGFLIKDMKVQHLITKNVNPKLEEVTMFARGSEDGTSNLDLASLAETLKNTTAEETYLPGDTVEVFQGEQQGVVGRTVSTRGDIVTLQVTEGELEGQMIDAPMKSLRKRFREGDHVKVIGGSRYQDEVGMVVQVKGDSVTLLSDMSMQEITVFSKDLRLSADTGTDGKLGMFDVHDLVQLEYVAPFLVFLFAYVPSTNLLSALLLLPALSRLIASLSASLTRTVLFGLFSPLKSLIRSPRDEMPLPLITTVRRSVTVILFGKCTASRGAESSFTSTARSSSCTTRRRWRMQASSSCVLQMSSPCPPRVADLPGRISRR